MVPEEQAPFYIVEEITCHACATSALVTESRAAEARKHGTSRAGRYVTVRERG